MTNPVTKVYLKHSVGDWNAGMTTQRELTWFPATAGRSLVLLTVLLTPFTWAGPAAAQTAPSTNQAELTALHELGATQRRGRKLVSAVERLSGTADLGLSPLLVLGVGGAYGYATHPADQPRPILYHPAVWGAMLLVVLAMGAKDTVLSGLGPLKKPLDLLGVFVSFAGYFIGLAYLALRMFGGTAGGSEAAASSGVIQTVLFVLSLVLYTSVWIVSNCIEVLILISPLPGVDAVLKTVRTGLVALLMGLAWLHPVLGFLAALPILLISLWAAGRCLRFTVLGLAYAKDLLLRKDSKTTVADGRIPAFACLGVNAPIFGYGVVHNSAAGGPCFTYRWGLIGPRCTARMEDDKLAVSKGILNPYLVSTDEPPAVLLRFSPRWSGREEELARQLGVNVVAEQPPGGRDTSTLGSFGKWFGGQRTEPV